MHDNKHFESLHGKQMKVVHVIVKAALVAST